MSRRMGGGEGRFGRGGVVRDGWHGEVPMLEVM